MIVKMLKTAQSDAGAFLAGKKYNIADDLGKAYIKAEAAVELKKSGLAEGEEESYADKLKKAKKELSDATKRKASKKIIQEFQDKVDDLVIEKLEKNG